MGSRSRPRLPPLVLLVGQIVNLKADSQSAPLLYQLTPLQSLARSSSGNPAHRGSALASQRRSRKNMKAIIISAITLFAPPLFSQAPANSDSVPIFHVSV